MRRRSVRDAISAPPRKVTPPQCMRLRARRGRVDARNVRACGRARGLGYDGYEGYGGYDGYGGYASALRADGGTTRRFATRVTTVGIVSRLHAGMRRACGHARRADLPSRAGGFASLGLPAHVPPRTAYLLSCWVPWATGATGATMGARCGASR